jgi:hypothetical protein
MKTISKNFGTLFPQRNSSENNYENCILKNFKNWEFGAIFCSDSLYICSLYKRKSHQFILIIFERPSY